VGDSSELNKLSGWKPKRDIKTLVAETFDWLKQNEHNLKNILG